ncbi:MAG: hypothetical protein R3E39_15695 [Anaerolineae bacterium]
MLTKKFFLIGIFVFAILAGVIPVLGQQPPKAIALGKLETGAITADVPEALYSFTARANLGIEIEVLVADGDLTPRITISQDGAVLQSWDGTQGEKSSKAKYTFEASGQYVISIGNISDTTGIYVLTIREVQGATITQISADLPLSASVARGETLTYQVQADASAATTITIDVENLTQSVSVALKAPDGKTIGSVGQSLNGGSFRIPAGSDQFVIEVSNSNQGSVPVDFKVLVSRSA